MNSNFFLILFLTLTFALNVENFDILQNIISPFGMRQLNLEQLKIILINKQKQKHERRQKELRREKEEKKNGNERLILLMRGNGFMRDFYSGRY
jgi:hypothetical protein